MTDVSTNSHNPLIDVIQDVIGGFANLFTHGQRELLTVLRQPTPLNISSVYQANAAGVIGGGLTIPDPVTLFQCPMSHEAWINRIGITSPGHPPGAPLTTGQAICSGSTAAELIFFLPLGGVVAPVLITEGRLSAMQLNNGERMLFSADGLPANTQLKIDLQIVLVTGISPDTPLPASTRIRNVNVVD